MAKKVTLKKKNIVNRNKKLFNKKLKNKLKNLGLTEKDEIYDFMVNVFNILIIYYLCYIIFVSGIIYYINQIKDCKCFQEKNKLVGVNITYIYMLEIIILILGIVMFVQLVIAKIFIKKNKSGGNNENSNILLKITFLINIIVSGYLIYNIIKLSQIPIDDCECDKSSLRYLLYIQATIMTISLFFNGYMIVTN
jgi:hypothetical protein